MGGSFFQKEHVGFKRDTPRSLRPSIYKVGCFSWMIPKHYIKNGGFTTISIHPLKHGCLGFFRHRHGVFDGFLFPIRSLPPQPGRARYRVENVKVNQGVGTLHPPCG